MIDVNVGEFVQKMHKKLNNMQSYVEYDRSVLTIIIACMVTLSACGDLTRLPQDQVTNEVYWNSPQDIETYNNQFYSYFRRHFSFWAPDLYYDDGASDNMAPLTDISANNNRIAGLNTVNSGNAQWSTWYSRIRDANIAIANARENDLLDGEEGKRYVGEARFFRAYFYYQLVRLYGAVPWITKPLNTESDELQVPRTPRNQVMDSILVDLDYAIANLPPKSTTGINRLNQETTLQFKSRVALFEGTWEKYHQGDPFGVSDSNPQKYLQSAVEAAKRLIDMNTSSLAPDYSKLFNQNDLGGNPEILLERQYSVPEELSAMIQRRVARHGGGTGLTKSLVESYLMNDGEPISVSDRYQGDATLEDVVASRDPRLDAILKVPGDTLATNSDGSPRIFEKPRLAGGGVLPTTTGYSLQKGAAPDRGIPGQGQQGPALPLFRYAETLLNYAEAKAELGTITQQDLDMSINKLRDRVNMPHLVLGSITTDPNWDYPNLSPAINEIRRERRIELACESYRLDDILRWAAGDKLFTGYIPLGYKFQPDKYPDITVGEDIYLNNDGYVVPFEKKFANGLDFNPSRDYLLAIPPNQITLNSNLTQNPGWN